VRRALVLAASAALMAACPPADDAYGKASGPCPTGMAFIDVGEHPYCIDRWEASLVEVTATGEIPFSPYESVKGQRVRAVSYRGAIPQAYISKNEASSACKASRKRLCTEVEWETACRGRKPTTFPYGDLRREGYCNDHGTSPLKAFFPGLGPEAFQPDAMNDPRLNQQPGTLAATGSHARCTNSFGVFDMVGNVHEWVEDAPEGPRAPPGRAAFRGGYYLDTHINGDGCAYRTTAHDASYHDYSTGFRCCADPRR
jgi:formylglycine-generating enzyme required for sulfatase activity